MAHVYKNIVIGIPTYNRKIFVDANAEALRNAEMPSDCNITFLIVDDASTEFSTDYLASVYPPGSIVIRRDQNSGGADQAICDLFRRCVERDADAILLLDSDLIVSKSFISKGLSFLGRSDGVVSLFNTLNHPTKEDLGELLVKESVGSAGTFWDGALAREISENIESGRRWDWRFCSYIRDSGRKVFCARNSLVQHLAYYDGQNSNLGSGDYGVGFVETSLENVSLTLESVVRAQIMLGQKLASCGDLGRLDGAIAEFNTLSHRLMAMEQRLPGFFEFESRIRKLEKYSLRLRLKRLFQF
jgi:glycosyltransferase involved in cell wall biosynthesis